MKEYKKNKTLFMVKNMNILNIKRNFIALKENYNYFANIICNLYRCIV